MGGECPDCGNPMCVCGETVENETAIHALYDELLVEEIKRLREALKVIANIRNTRMDESMRVDICIEKARQALEEK